MLFVLFVYCVKLKKKLRNVATPAYRHFFIVPFPHPIIMMSSLKVKLGRSTWPGGHRRRSPRISGRDSWKSEPDSGLLHKLEKPAPPSGPTTKRNSRIKRKRQQLHAVSSSITEASQVESDGEPVNCCDEEASIIPEKKVLEHILDTLQRRDTYEIFAEPVDQDEVVDYYEIIKEPMDFGTMRAKLHEGMYENLEQFKHDVFLITENAMHFNSSSTIYFRQARAIHELSKRVFHVLEMDPKNFESEFLITRRRSTRRPPLEAKVCRLSTEIKPASPPKDTPNTVAASDPGLERNGKETPKPAIFPFRGNTRRINGAKDGRRSNNIETDRRCSYIRPQKSFFHSNNNIFHSKYLEPKPILTNTQDFNYRESLLLFVKELGPTAQMIATRRTQGLQETPSCHCGVLQETNYQEPTAHASIYSTDSVSGREKTNAGEDHKVAYNRKGRGCCYGLSSEKDKTLLECSEGTGYDTSTEKRFGGSNGSAVSKTSMAYHNQIVEVSGRLDENVRPVILALEHSRANSWEPKSRNKKPNTCPPPSSSRNSFSRSDHQVVAMPLATLSALEPIMTTTPVAVAAAAPAVFTFDMNFLKAKLKQMKVVGLDKQVMATNEYGCTPIDNSKSQSFPNKELGDTDLALQL